MRKKCPKARDCFVAGPGGRGVWCTEKTSRSWTSWEMGRRQRNLLLKVKELVGVP